MTDTNDPNNPSAGVDFPMDEAPPETPVASHGPNPVPEIRFRPRDRPIHLILLMKKKMLLTLKPKMRA